MSLELSETLKKTVDQLTGKFSDKIIDIYQSTGDTYVRIEPDSVPEIFSYLKNDLDYVYLSDLFGADRYTSEDRFEVIYNLISFKTGARLFVKVWLEEENPELESVTKVWPSANWLEREVYDMYGVHFKNHPDLRRMYLPEDFQYYPLRKEFPLLGIPGSIELPNTTPDTE